VTGTSGVAISDQGSFQDPAGTVLEIDGRIFRSVAEVARADYETLRDAGFYDELIGKGLLVAHGEVGQDGFSELPENTAYLLEHTRIPFISYPYEWSFFQLRTAALAHLDLQLLALDRGFILRDASAYNIQFVGSQPIFIDTLSFRPYREGEYWYAHKQFCEHFLCPLLLRAKLGIAHNAWYRGNLDGIPVADLNRALPLSKKLSWRLFTNVLMQARLQEAASDLESGRIARMTDRKLPKRSYHALLLQMRRWIEGLEPAGQRKTTWAEYVESHTYDDGQWHEKNQIVGAFAASVGQGVFWDIGCNTGHFSELALQNGASYVVGFDFDQGALERAYQRSSAQRLNFLPLFLDASNPPSDQGWREAERKGLGTRRNAGAVVALAFVHHLAIAKNVPLAQVLEWITSLAPVGLIEFVPRDDPTVKKMLLLRQDATHPYDEEVFLGELSKLSRVVEITEVTDVGRKLVRFEKGRG
jgi:ribosomal protein L11 methylase PrmA